MAIESFTQSQLATCSSWHCVTQTNSDICALHGTLVCVTTSTTPQTTNPYAPTVPAFSTPLQATFIVLEVLVGIATIIAAIDIVMRWRRERV